MNMHATNFGAAWTDERVDALKKLWADGLSASQIAGELGGITRSAVIGKVHRLGLSGRARRRDRVERPGPRKFRPKAGAMAMRAGLTPLQVTHAPKMIAEPVIDNAGELVVPIGQRRFLDQLTADTCRWPFGDPREIATASFFYCGGIVCAEGEPYCAHHAVMSINPRAPRKFSAKNIAFLAGGRR